MTKKLSFLSWILTVIFISLNINQTPASASNLVRKNKNTLTANISAVPTFVSAGGSANISWSSTNANSCLTSWGQNTLNGTYIAKALPSTTTFEIACKDRMGQIAKNSVTVTVTNQVEQPNPFKIPTSKEELRNLELTYLRAVISQAELLNYAYIEIPGFENIFIGNDEGSPFLALRTYTGQPLKNGGVRAEIAIDYPFKEGDTLLYSWQIRIPENFQSDAPKNRWWIVANWHDQPDVFKGETWKTYVTKSAPIIFGYGNINGKDLFGFTYGTQRTPIGTIPVTRNVWHTITVEITWSQTANGKAKVYFDHPSTPVFSVTGPNMLNGYQHFLKTGSYRHPDIVADSTINMRNLTIKKIQ